MAEPEPPRSDNGKNRLDRDVTPLRGPNRPPLLVAGLTCGVILMVGMWFVLGGEEEVGPPARPQTVDPAKPSVVLVPRQEPPPPPLVQQVPPSPSPAPPAVDPLDEQRARLLLARIQRLQQELDKRRRSKMLVMSHTPRAPTPSPAGVSSAALDDGGAPLPGPGSAALTGTIGDNTLRVGNVGPVGETPAVQARLLPSLGYTITEGTVIPGVLETAIHSDLPGMVRAMNSADVYSHDGSQLLIPKGSRLVGRYQSDVRRGQSRVFIIWNRILRADGMSILINSPGTDPLSRAGLEGDVDTHFFQIFGAAILLSILDGGLDIAIEMARRQGDDNTMVIQNDSGLSRAGEIALQDSIQIQPTIHVDQGTRISILVARDLDFRSVELARRE